MGQSRWACSPRWAHSLPGSWLTSSSTPWDLFYGTRAPLSRYPVCHLQWEGVRRSHKEEVWPVKGRKIEPLPLSAC
jgi:hypothetical protein